MREGKALTPLDLLIAAHAVSRNAILVTNDRVFANLDVLSRVDWQAD